MPPEADAGMKATVVEGVTRSIVFGRLVMCDQRSSLCAGRHVETKEEFAVKLEPGSAKHPQLIYEAKVLKLLAGGSVLYSLLILILLLLIH